MFPDPKPSDDRPAARGWALACALALWVLFVLSAAPARAQDSDLPAPADINVPGDALQAQVQLLGQQINELQNKAQGQKPLQVQALANQAGVRAAAVDLLNLAIDDGSGQTSFAGVAGMTLVHNLGEFDQLFQDFAATAVDPTVRKTAASPELLAQAAAQFQRHSENPDSRKPDKSRDSVDQFLQRRLAWTQLLCAAMNQPGSVRAWPAAAADSQIAQETITPPTAEQLQALAGQVTIELSPQAFAHFQSTLQVLQAGRGFADLLPRVTQAAVLMQQVAKLITTAGAAKFLDLPARKQLDEALAKALQQYADPAQRPQAVKALNTLTQLTPQLARLGRLEELKAPVTELQGLVVSILKSNQAIQQQSLLDFLDRLGAAMLSYRQSRASNMPEDYRTIFTRLERFYLKDERAALDVVKQVEGNVDLVYQPTVTAPLASLEKDAEDLRRITLISDWSNRSKAFNPRPTYGVSQRLKDRAADLPETAREPAARELEAFEKQLARFALLPGEAQLQGETGESPDSPWALMGKQTNVLVKLIELHRSNWASAWASGQTPPNSALIMEGAAGLVQTLYRSQQLLQAAKEPTLLSRWAAVEIDADLFPAAAEAQTPLIRNGIRTAVDGQAQAMAHYLTTIPAGQRAALFLADLQSRLTPQLKALPTGVPGVLSQLLYRPAPSSFLGESEMDLALFSRAIQEARFAAKAEDTRQAQAMFELCDQLAGRISARLEGR